MVETQPGLRRNHRGYRIGECHQHATVPTEIVHELRSLHEHKHLRVQQLIELFAQRDPPLKLNYWFVRNVVANKTRCFG